MNNGANSFAVYMNAENYVQFISAGSSGFPMLEFNANGKFAGIYGSSSLFAIDTTSILTSIGPSSAQMNLVGAPVTINHVDVLSSLESKAAKSSYTGTLYVSSASGGPATRAISVVNGVIQ